MNKNRLTLVGVWLLAALGAKAQNTMTLEQCVNYALENHVSIKNAQLEQQKAGLTIKETKTKGLPQVDGVITFTENIKVQSQFLPANAFNPLGDPTKTIPLGFGVPHSGNTSITASQLLFSGSYLVGLEASKTYQSLSDKLKDRTEQEVVVNVSKSYFNSIIIKENIEMLKATIKQLEKIESDLVATVQVGFVEQIELSKLTVKLNNVRSELENLKVVDDFVLHVLKFQMGHPLDQQLTLAQKTNDFTSNIDFNIIPAFELNNNLDFQTAQIQKDLTQLNVKNVKMSRYPTAAIFGNFGANYGAIQYKELYKFSQWKPYAMVGAQVNVPIFHSFADKYILEKQMINVKILENQITQLSSASEIKYKTSLQSYQKNKLAIQSQKNNVDLAQKIFENTKIKYQNGLATSTDLLSAETELNTSQRNYLGALNDLLISKIDLDQSAGALVIPQRTK